MYSLNWHRLFDVCELVDVGRCECFLSLTLVWLDASTRVDTLSVNGALCSNIIIMPPLPYGRRHCKMGGGVCLSVCPSVYLSVCPVPQHSSGMERPRKPKFGVMEGHNMCNPWTYLEVKRSNVKVTRSIKAHTLNAQYFPNEMAYELQTWYIYGGRRPYHLQAPWPPRSKVKVTRLRNESDSVGR